VLIGRNGFAVPIVDEGQRLLSLLEIQTQFDVAGHPLVGPVSGTIHTPTGQLQIVGVQGDVSVGVDPQLIGSEDLTHGLQGSVENVHMRYPYTQIGMLEGFQGSEVLGSPAKATVMPVLKEYGFILEF